MRGLFRSTLILFLQPAWGDPMVPMPSQVHSGPVQPEGVSDTATRGPERGLLVRGTCSGATECREPGQAAPAVESAASSIETVDGGQCNSCDVAAVLSASEAACSPLGDALPPLRERWVCGMTFADFSQRTARAYYGARGSQTPGR